MRHNLKLDIIPSNFFRDIYNLWVSNIRQFNRLNNISPRGPRLFFTVVAMDGRAAINQFDAAADDSIQSTAALCAQVASVKSRSRAVE